MNMYAFGFLLKVQNDPCTWPAPWISLTATQQNFWISENIEISLPNSPSRTNKWGKSKVTVGWKLLGDKNRMARARWAGCKHSPDHWPAVKCRWPLSEPVFISLTAEVATDGFPRGRNHQDPQGTDPSSPSLNTMSAITLTSPLATLPDRQYLFPALQNRCVFCTPKKPKH